MAEQGFILDIDTQFLQRLEKADKALDKMVSSVDRVASSLDGLSSGSLSKFANSIDQIVASINGLSQTKVGDMGFSEATNSVSQTVDKVNDLVGAIREVSNESAKSSLSFDVSDYESPAKVQALIEKNRAALERAQTRLPKWEGRLAESLKTDPEQSKKSTQGVALRVKEINDEIKALNDTYNQLSQRLVVAKERTQELLNASRQGGFKDIATMTAIKEAQKERIESGGFSARAEQQKYVDAYVDANDQIKEQYKSTSEALNDEDKARYELWLMQKHTETKEHKRLEDEKYKATEDAIRKQNEAYAKQESLDEINKRRKENERKEEASIAREDAANKRKAQSVIDNYIKETEAARKSYEERQKMYDRLFNEQEEQERRTVSGAMNYSANASSIAELKQAVKYLEEARDGLTKDSFSSDKEYKKTLTEVNDEIENRRRVISELCGEQNKLNSIYERTKKLATAAFSFSAIRGYVNRIVEIRGEFELQRRSLEALLGSKEEANRLWNQTIKLAVKSPFEVKQLITYTKQLAAYRVEVDKLHESTKMLADISAGLGVDMGRLILAYGQVKAANYLRGTELRQFSEAGINVLEELATYYSEIEKRTVSVGDVFERVSARMVSFDDVEKVLKRVTSAGGQFYRMQEIQSETLKGQMRNLKDSIDLMVNDIGKSNEGVLRASVATLRWLINNYEGLAKVLKIAAIAFVNFRVSALLAAKGVTSIKDAFNSIKSSISGLSLNHWILGLTVVAGIVTKIVGQFAELRNITKEYANLVKPVKEVSVSFEKAFSESDVTGMKNALNELSKIAEKDFAIRASIDENASKEGIKESFDRLREEIFKESAFSQEFAKAFTKKENRDFWIDTQFWDWNLASKDIEQFAGRANTLFNNLQLNSSNFVYELNKIKSELSDDELKALDVFNQPIGDRSQYEYLNDMAEAYGILKDRLKDTEAWSGALNRQFRRFGRTSEEVIREFEPTLKAMDELVEGLDDATKERRLKLAIDKLALHKDWGDIEKGLLYEITNKRYNIHITPIFGSPNQDSSEPWIDRVKNAVDKLNDEIVENGGGIDVSKLFPVPSAGQTKDQYMAFANEVIGIAEKTYVDGQEIVDQAVVERAKILKPYLDMFKKILNIDSSKTDDDRQDKTLSGRVSLIKEMRSEYEKLRKVMGDTAATEEVISSYRKTFGMAFEGTGISLSDFFRTDEGVIGKLRELSSIADSEGREAKISLEREIGKIDVQLRVRSLEETDAEFAQSIEDMFSGYELSVELGKLNIPTSFAKDYFGVETSSLDDIKNALYETKTKEEIGSERYKKIEEFERKITDLETREQQERLKKYLVYARDAVGERAKIKLEEMKKLQEIEIAFARKPFETEQERNVRETAKASAIEGVQNEAYQATKKLEWEEFQKSDTFISIFQDLDMASEALLNHAIAKLREFKDSWKDMPHEEMKSIVQNIEKLEMQLASMGNPFKGYIELKKELDGVGSIEEIQLDTMNQEAKIEALDKELSISEQVLSLHQEGKDFEADELAMANERLDLFGATAKEVKDIVDAQKNSKNEAQGQIAANNGNLSKIKAAKAELLKQADTMGKVQDMANDLYNSFKELNDVLGDDDGPEAIFAEMGMSMMDSVFNCIMLQKQLKAASEGADAFGKAMNKAMGIIGWIVMAVQVLSSVLGAIFKAHDNKLERQIQRIQSRVEELNDRFEKLNELMDKAFSTEAISAYSLEAQKNIKEQIDAYDRMIELEKDKKKTDSAKIKEYREAQRELQEQYEELIAEGFSKATGGILDDTLSAAREFVDAWYEAFKETGSGLGGLKKHFQELFKELALQQMTLQVMTPYVNMLKDKLEAYINPEAADTVLTPEEAQDLKNFWEAIAQDANNNLSNLANALGIADMKQSELSDLSKGIQGVTESTAQVLEALLNSMRFFVADSNTQLRDLKAAFMSSDVTMNPILNELKQHTQLIRSIESMFDSVIGRGGSNHNGAYLRVLM